MAGLLSVVGTPIGNLSDASPRVIETLGSSDVLLCEDTRVTSKLLARFGVHVPLMRADENVLAERVDEVVRRLGEGEHVSFVSDAGMPGVSDPGQRLVDAVLAAGLAVEVIPGPSAVTCAIAASGLLADHFFFEGFLPRKAGPCRTRLQELALVPGAIVVYESPRRVAGTLALMAEAFSGRRVALLRELTKLHEECVRAEASELASLIEERVAEQGELKGECVIVVEMPTEEQLTQARHSLGAGPSAATIEEAAQAGLAAGEPKSKLAKRLAKEFGVARSEAYDVVLAQG